MMDPVASTGAGAGPFGILLFPGVEELDAIGPWEMVALWARQSGGPERCLMIGQGEAPITCAKGLVLVPHASFATAPPLDVLLVPGGQGTRTELYAYCPSVLPSRKLAGAGAGVVWVFTTKSAMRPVDGA